VGLDVREIFYNGQWYAIEGKKKAFKSLDQNRIEKLCTTLIDRTEASDEDFTVRKLGSRHTYVQEKPSGAPAKAFFLLQPFIGLRNAWLRFHEFVTHRKLKEKEEEKANFRFVMQLFGSEDEELLDRVFPSDPRDVSRGDLPSLSFSSVLKIWIDTMEGQHDPQLESTIATLRKLESYQRSIEALRHMKSPRQRAEARKKLNEAILQDLRGLQESAKVYVPGGVWNPKTGKSLPMIYEITKKKDGGYTLRAIDISGQLFQPPPAQGIPPPSAPQDQRQEAEEQFSVLLGKKKEEKRESYLEASYDISEDEIKERINECTLILSGFESPKAQAEGKPEKTSKLGANLLYLKDKCKGWHCAVDEWEEASATAQKEGKELTRESLVLRGEVEKGQIAKHKKTSSFEEAQLTRTFLRIVEPEVYKSEKRILRARHLLAMWDHAGDHINDPEFRNFMVTQIKVLLSSIESLPKPNPEYVDKLKETLEKIFAEIEKIDKRQTLTYAQGGLLPSDVSPRFVTPLHPELSVVASSSFKAQTAAPLIPPTTQDIGSIIQSKNVTALKAHVQMLEGLAKKGQYAVLHYQLKKDFLVLKQLEASVVELAKGDNPQEWMEQLKELGFLVQQCSYGLGRISPSPEDISFVLRSFMLQDKMARANPNLANDLYVQSFAFDILPIEKILRNPYLSLGESAQDITEVLTYFKNLQKPGIRGKWCGDKGFEPDRTEARESSTQTADREFFRQYAREGKSASDVAQDINGSNDLVPPHVVHLRQSYLLLQTFVAPTRTFIPYTMKDFGRMTGALLEDVSGASFAELFANAQKIAYKKMAQKIPDFLRGRNARGPIHFAMQTSGPLGDSRVITVEPWDMSIFDLDDSAYIEGLGSRLDAEHMGSFDRLGVLVEDPLLRERCFEQVVSERSEEKTTTKGFDDAGRQVESEYSPFREHRMRGRTEWQIVQDRARILGLDLHTSRQLQLMETGPQTIIQNTLAFLGENKALFSDKKYGPAIARLVERNLFRNAVFNTAADELKQFARNEITRLLHEAKASGDIASYLRLFSILRQMYAGSVFPQQLQAELNEPNLEILAKEQSCSRMLYQEQLLSGGKADKDKITLLFKLKSSPPLYWEQDPLKEQQIQELSLDMLSSVPSANEEFIKTLLTSLGEVVPEGAVLTQVGSSGFVFTYGQYQIDFSRFEMWQNNQRKEMLPPSVTEASSFSVLDSIYKEARTVQWTASPVVLPGQTKEALPLEGTQYSLETPDKQMKFRLIFTSDGILRIYRRKMGEEKWFLYEPTLFAEPPSEKEKTKPVDMVPRVLSQGNCWVREDGKELFVEQGGRVLYKAQLSGLPALQIRLLEKVEEQPTETTTVVNVFGRRDFERFCDIERQGHVVAYATRTGELVRIGYTRSETPYSYVWNTTKGRWDSEQSTGYFLSDKSLERYATPSPVTEQDTVNPAVQQGFTRLQGLFHPGFHSYHLLEHETKSAQLVMPRVRLQSPPHVKDPSQRFVPQFVGDKIPQYVFDIDPIKGLVPKKQPEGYLYLAYSLMVQGNYTDAFFYLDKANLRRPLGEEGREIFGWLKKQLATLPQDRPEIIPLRVRLFLMEPILTGKQIDPQSIAGQKRALEAYQFLDLVQQRQGEFPEGMALTELELRQLKQLKERSMISFLYSITKDAARWKLTEDVPDLLKGMFEEDAEALPEWVESLRGQTNLKEQYLERFPILRLYHAGKISEEEFSKLKAVIPHLAIQEAMWAIISAAHKRNAPLTDDEMAQLQKMSCEIGVAHQTQGFLSEFDKLQALRTLTLWRDFDEQVLKPFNVSLRELLFMKEEGGLEALFSRASSDQKAQASSLLQQAVALSEIREKFAVRAEIKELQAKVKQVPEERPLPTRVLQGTHPTRLFSEEEVHQWGSFFGDVPPAAARPKLTSECVSEALSGAKPKEGETYAQAMDRGLREDLRENLQRAPDVPQEVREAAGAEGQDVRTDTMLGRENREGLRSSLQTLRDGKSSAADEKRKACIEILRQQGTPASSLMDRLRRVGRLSPEALFETAVRSYGEHGNFDRLESLGVKLTPDNKRDLRLALREYLKLSIQARQLQRCLEIEAELPEDPAKEEEYLRGSREIQSLLQASWQYNVEEDPLAPTLLLIEYELGFVCRKSQIEVVRENLGIENRFKQEMCGGGKTTVLRNIISQFRADGRTLSGVSTLEPLRGEHGLMYARTTKNAFGETVFDFHFDRGVPTDERSLLHLHQELLLATVEKGRIDLSKGDLQSFKLAKNLKHEEIRKKREEQARMAAESEEWKGLEGEIEQLHAEIDIMEDIWDFMSDHVAIMADELDKDCDPTQEKNYAYGESREIDIQKRQAILTIFSKVLAGSTGSLQKLGEAIRANKQAKMDSQERQNALRELAIALYQEYKGKEGFPKDLTQEEFISYILKPEVPEDQKARALTEAQRIYHKIFDQYKGKELPEVLQQLAWTRKFLWENFTTEAALSKTGGVNYGRAKDDVSVIPYAGSDKPKERSQHGNDMERLVYTCLDYVQRGLSSEQVRAAYIKAKDDALKEVLLASKRGKKLSVDDTKAAKKFKNQFLAFLDEPIPTLSTVLDTQLESIRTKITKNPELLLQFLGDTVLSDMRQSEAKIVSDAQDPPNMVKSYSGSSGTDTGCHALPDKIHRKDARQPGVHGEVIRWLLETEAGQGRESTFISLERDEGLYTMLGEQMHGGDCISDVGRLFPGISPRTIAENLLKQNIDGVKYVVFMNPDDKWVMLTRDGDGFKEVKYEASEDSKVVKERITIFDDVHTRGAERSSTAGVTEFVTLDVDTDWSRFEQGVMRERNLTKGKANIRYILSPELTARLGENPSVNALITLLTENEAKQLQVLNYKAERQKIKHILKRFGEQALRDISRSGRDGGYRQHHKVREVLYDTLRKDLYMVSNTVDVFEAASPQGEQTATEALDALVTSQVARLDDTVHQLEHSFVAAVKSPVVVRDLRADLERLNGDIEAILAAQEQVNARLQDMKKKYEQSLILHRIAPETVGQKLDAAAQLFATPEIQEQIRTLKEKQKELKVLLQKLEDVSSTAQELSMDVLAPFKAECQAMHEQIQQARAQIAEKKREIEGKTDEEVEELQEREQQPSSKPSSEGLMGAFKRWGAAAKETFVKVAKKVAEKIFTKIFAWSTDDSVGKVVGALTSLDDAFRSTDDTLQRIESAGEPLVKIACTTLENGRAYLQAKLSDERRSKIPSQDAEKVAGLVADGYGRVDSRFLPAKVSSGMGESGNEQEVEQEQEQEQEVEDESELGAETIPVEGAFPHKEIQATVPQLFSDQLLPNIYRLSAYTSLFPKGKIFTENCFPVTASGGKIRPWEEVKAGKVTIPAAQQYIARTLLVVDTDTGTVVELYGSRLDGERLFPKLKDRGQYKVFTYNYSLERFEGGDVASLSDSMRKEMMRHVATTKLLRGDVEFFKDEEKPDSLLDTYGALVDYLRSLDPADRRSLKESVQRIIVAQQKSSFEGSDVARAFEEAEKPKKP
jgi:hypothetical protein